MECMSFPTTAITLIEETVFVGAGNSIFAFDLNKGDVLAHLFALGDGVLMHGIRYGILFITYF